MLHQAFAKQHGSYDAISGGHVCDAFEALTGAPTETVMLGESIVLPVVDVCIVFVRSCMGCTRLML